ncbi:E3 ubiquitin-protein ligase rad18 [Pseudocyphellaria aurata]|nr:E3 ubiquitin-protein ligase rad18 [Pseudocyphellaria aurata]
MSSGSSSAVPDLQRLLVDAFQVARPALVQLGKDRQLAASESSQRKSKRKFDESRSDESGNGDGHCTRQRKTRSQTAAASKAHHVEAINTAEVDDQNGEYQPEDGLIPCPICNQRMKEEDVFAHLDVHNEPDFTPGTKPSISSMRISTDGSTRTQSSRPPDRLPQLSYSLLKDVALRKKLTDLGIPSGGSRALMIRRHTEWVNMVNANSDSARPRSKSELLHELRVWDKSQGRQIPNAPEDAMGASSVMRKDFDGTAWATSHDDDFQRLISKARQKVADKSAHKSHDAPVPHYETDNQETANQSRGISFHASSSPQGFNPPDSSRGVQSPKPDGEAPMPQQCDDQGNI